MWRKLEFSSVTESGNTLRSPSPNQSTVDPVPQVWQKQSLKRPPRLKKECEVLEGLSKMGSAGNPSNGFETFSNIDSRWNSSKPSVFDHCQSLQSNTTINARHLIGAGTMFLFTDWKPNVSFANFCVFCEITVVWVGWSGVQSKQKILRVKAFDWISRLCVGQRQALVCLDVCLDGAKCFPDWQQLTSRHTWHVLIAKMNLSEKQTACWKIVLNSHWYHRCVLGKV